MLTLEAPLVTKRLRLRPFRSQDADALYDLRSCPEVLRYLYWPPASVEGVREVVAARLAMTKLAADGDCLVLAVEVAATGSFIGEVDLSLVSTEHRHGEIGVILHPSAQGHGYATEAVGALLNLAFDVLKLHRVTAQTSAGNQAAAGAMLRLGMRQEGHLRQCVRFAGEWYDELIFAILAEEWANRTGSAPSHTEGGHGFIGHHGFHNGHP
ncbi:MULTISPECIES: GNAT family N-acetyltransferase [unclassified Actinoplanes]|uniref:GNAT family N-acetyltransferase n=1 Tax=unclassified Actinoplanes TaxID=2626549 RepID=UPI000693F36B|nr:MULTISPECIES: GNAT family protein [unclassified Actinoplanes]